MKIDIKKFNFESDKILSALSEVEKSVFLQKSESLFFKKGKLIFYDGGIPTGVFLIRKGKAKIYKTGADGKDQIFYIYKDGDLLGYHALLCNESYEDSCEAIEDCELLFVSAEKFEALQKEIPHIRQLIIQNMGHEFGVLVNHITTLAQKSLRERLALFLIVLQHRYDGKAINLSRDDLANIVGTARESLGRLLKEFKENKLISIQGRNIQLLDRESLIKISTGIHR